MNVSNEAWNIVAHSHYLDQNEAITRKFIVIHPKRMLTFQEQNLEERKRIVLLVFVRV